VLRSRLHRASIVDVDADSPLFAFGRTAEVLEEATGERHRWTLVGSTESNLAEGRLSAESPVGRALRDAPVGKTVRIQTPKGERAFTVEKLLG
jgi:transcription elongation factor GreA